MNIGLRNEDINYIIETIKHFKEIDKAVIFGSRAKGNYKPGSDIDIAIYGEKINIDTLSKLRFLLEEESHMPYMFDVVDASHLSNQALKDHIVRVGRVIYERNNDHNDSG